jgi:Ca2+-binding RTX toxin-like protein
VLAKKGNETSEAGHFLVQYRLRAVNSRSCTVQCVFRTRNHPNVDTLQQRVTGTAGSDLFIGGAGADTFSFAGLSGTDIIADFAAAGAAHDIINFHGSSVLNSFANVLSQTTQVGTGVVISQDASNTLMLNNTTKASLTSANFTFV